MTRFPALEGKDGRVTVVPAHPAETIGPGLFAKILRDVDMTRDDDVQGEAVCATFGVMGAEKRPFGSAEADRGGLFCLNGDNSC